MIGAILGILGGALPKLIKLWQDRQDKKHELAIMDKQIIMQEKGMQYHLEEIQTQGEVETMKALYEMSKPVDFKPTGIAIADIITRFFEVIMYFYRSSVQPTVTFAMIAFYGMIKYSQYKVALTMGSISNLDALLTIWTSFDQEILSAIVAFWFTGRVFQRAGAYKQK